MADIFISYRRDGGDMTAMYIYQALKDRGYSIFYDVEVLRSGKFNETLLTEIQACKDFIIVLSPHALDRCQEQDDWVRREVAEAIRCNKNIIPIMMNGFRFPDSLPEDIDSLRFHTGLTSSTEYFQESMNRLCDRFLVSKVRKKKWVIPAVAAILLCVAVVGIILANRPVTETPAETAAGSGVASLDVAAKSVISTDLPVLTEELSYNGIECDDWLFTMPIDSDWDLELLEGEDLSARVEGGSFWIDQLPHEEGASLYRATCKGQSVDIVLNASVPEILPEDAVLLDESGKELVEKTISAGEELILTCTFVPEGWTFLDQPQEIGIWLEGDENPEVLNYECNGNTGTMSIAESGDYNIGVKVTSGHAVAYRFFHLTVK